MESVDKNKVGTEHNVQSGETKEGIDDDDRITARGQKVPAPIGRPGRRKNKLRGVEHPAVGADVRGSRGEEPEHIYADA